MFTSFSTALSGLNADSTGIDVIANNLANLNTVGFKASTVSFHDLVTQSLGAGLGETQVGFGVGPPTTTAQFTQGALQTTSGPLDAAVQGDGFFVVQTSSGAIQYTRAGNFQVDENGDLETATGEKVQGWTAGAGGVIDTNAPVTDIAIPTGTVKPPIATQNFSFDINLNAAATAGATDGTFSTSVTAYDSLGGSHIVTATFTESATPGQWNYSIGVPDSDVLNPPATPLTGTLTFDSNGNLTSPAATDPAPQLQVQGLADGASDLTMNWNLYTGGTANITQYAQPSAVEADAQDGAASSQLVTVGIGSEGQILAQYSDGQQAVVGQIALANVRNPDSLISVGNNNFETSSLSSAPALGVPGTGGRGEVIGGSVESSTVDIATEFTNLIVLQRAYEANARVVTTVDQLSQDTIALKTE
jgi:flagellar hook protein FlgE